MNTPAFVDHCIELLAPLGAVRSRRMFGGHGLYVDDLFVAIIDDDRLYLKTSPEARPRYEAEGCEPFVYDSEGQGVALSYWSAPVDALESPALMQPWGRLALEAALAARAARRPKKPAAKKAVAKAAAKRAVRR